MEGIDISTLNIKEDDTIIITIDPDIIDLNTSYLWVENLHQNCNNDIIVKFKGINIEIAGTGTQD